MLLLLCFLALEQIKLSFEISRLHTNQQNLLTEYENFKDTNLFEADFTGSNITNANFEGANLNNTTWVDGKKCSLGSIGVCNK